MSSWSSATRADSNVDDDDQKHASLAPSLVPETVDEGRLVFGLAILLEHYGSDDLMLQEPKYKEHYLKFFQALFEICADNIRAPASWRSILASQATVRDGGTSLFESVHSKPYMTKQSLQATLSSILRGRKGLMPWPKVTAYTGDPKKWGYPVWETLHLISLICPQSKMKAFQQLLEAVPGMLPCARCAKGFRKIVDVYLAEPRAADTNAGGRFPVEMMLDLHRQVNAKVAQENSSAGKEHVPSRGVVDLNPDDTSPELVAWVPTNDDEEWRKSFMILRGLGVIGRKLQPSRRPLPGPQQRRERRPAAAPVGPTNATRVLQRLADGQPAVQRHVPQLEKVQVEQKAEAVATKTITTEKSKDKKSTKRTNIKRKSSSHHRHHRHHSHSKTKQHRHNNRAATGCSYCH